MLVTLLSKPTKVFTPLELTVIVEAEGELIMLQRLFSWYKTVPRYLRTQESITPETEEVMTRFMRNVHDLLPLA